MGPSKFFRPDLSPRAHQKYSIFTVAPMVRTCGSQASSTCVGLHSEYLAAFLDNAMYLYYGSYGVHLLVSKVDFSPVGWPWLCQLTP